MLSLRWTPDGRFCLYILDLLDGFKCYNLYRSHPWAFHFPTWAEGVVAQWDNPLTRASGLDYVFSTSAFQALALKHPTSIVPSSQLWAVGNEKTGGKPQFWDISLKGCCPQKKIENDKTKLSGKLVAKKISYNEPNLFLYADNTEIMEYSHSMVAI